MQDRSGETIEKYHLIRLLGQGGMGQVYVAEHTFTRRRVALKVLSGRLAENETIFARFQKEAQAAALIGHANMVQILDFGKDRSGAPYMAMELLTGEDLGQLIKRAGRLSIPLACYIMSEVLDTISAAHRNGVIHRDLKPENIFIHRREGASLPQVKILDFGISKFRESDMEGGGLTKTGSILGTPYYMSFEQASGVKVDERTDIYSIGVILYQLLTRTIPFKGPTVGAIILAIAEHAFERPSALRAEVPASLDAVILNAMAKSRDERFESAAEMRELVAPYFANHDVATLFANPSDAPLHPSPQMIRGDTAGGTREPGHLQGISFSPVKGQPASRSGMERAYGEPVAHSYAPPPPHPVTVPASSETSSGVTKAAPSSTRRFRALILGFLGLIVIGFAGFIWWQMERPSGNSQKKSSDGAHVVPSTPGEDTSVQAATESTPAEAQGSSLYKEWAALSHYAFDQRLMHEMSTLIYTREEKTRTSLLPVMVRFCKEKRASACGAAALIHQMQNEWDKAATFLPGATAQLNTIGQWAKAYQGARMALGGAGTSGALPGGARMPQATASAVKRAMANTRVDKTRMAAIRQLCYQGQAAICYSAAYIVGSGIGPSGKPDYGDAATYGSMGCSLNYPLACNLMCIYAIEAVKVRARGWNKVRLKLTLAKGCRAKQPQCCAALKSYSPNGD